MDLCAPYLPNVLPGNDERPRPAYSKPGNREGGDFVSQANNAPPSLAKASASQVAHGQLAGCLRTTTLRLRMRRVRHMENNHTAKNANGAARHGFRVHRGLRRSAPPGAIALFYGLGTHRFRTKSGGDGLAESFDHRVIGDGVLDSRRDIMNEPLVGIITAKQLAPYLTHNRGAMLPATSLSAN